MLVNINEIKVKRRIRKDLGDIDSLKESLNRYGLLHPITLNSNYELIAGQRRLCAAKSLGWTTINANIIEKPHDIDFLELELEENNQRKEFSDEELLEGYKRLQKIKNPCFFIRIWHALKKIFKYIKKILLKLCRP